jgi:hypothetical protein
MANGFFIGDGFFTAFFSAQKLNQTQSAYPININKINNIM